MLEKLRIKLISTMRRLDLGRLSSINVGGAPSLATLAAVLDAGLEREVARSFSGTEADWMRAAFLTDLGPRRTLDHMSRCSSDGAWVGAVPQSHWEELARVPGVISRVESGPALVRLVQAAGVNPGFYADALVQAAKKVLVQAVHELLAAATAQAQAASPGWLAEAATRALIARCRSGCPEPQNGGGGGIISKLLAAGAALGSRDDDGAPLLAALRAENAGVARLLIRKGAFPPGVTWASAALFAALEGGAPCTAVLLKAGAKVRLEHVLAATDTKISPIASRWVGGVQQVCGVFVFRSINKWDVARACPMSTLHDFTVSIFSDLRHTLFSPQAHHARVDGGPPGSGRGAARDRRQAAGCEDAGRP